ncbi:MAG: histidine kinase, partial [Deltaproteobacteria bacterium]|nr:histidine kinase [Deltaproteobacteria bacterium]
MAESFIDEIVRYVQFGREHMEALRGLHDHAAASFPAMADRFYQRLADHPQARAVFQSEEQVDRLKISLRNWFGTLLTGPWDESYFQQRARIGRAHVKVGLPQRYMLTAMNQIRDMLHEIAAASYPDREVVCRVVAAVDKVCDVELAMMLETYREDSVVAVTRV